MKKNSVLFLFACSLLVSALSCKKEETISGIEINTGRVLAEFADARTGTIVTHDFSAEPVEIDLTELRLSTRTVTTSNTSVKVMVNQQVVNDYNNDNGTAYAIAPSSTFSLKSTEYTLGPDQRKVMIKAILRPSSFIDDQYAIGLSIADISGGEISPVAKNVIVFISIKNDYDGIYSVKGYSLIPGSAFTGNFSLPCSEELEVATSGSSSVFLAPSQPVFNTGGFSYITNLLPEVTIDKATNKINSVTTRAGGLDLIYPYDAAYNSRYDPATKTIYVKYGVTPAGSGRYIIDTLTFCRPR